MKNKKILIIILSIIVVLIIGVVLIVILGKKDTSKKTIIINDINNISEIKKLDINILELQSSDLGYEVTISIKNNTSDIYIKSLKLSLKDAENKVITQLYFNINETIISNDKYISKLVTDQDLSNTKIIDYELVD